MNKHGMLLRAATLALGLALAAPVAVAAGSTATESATSAIPIAELAVPASLEGVRVDAVAGERPVVTLVGDGRMEHRSFMLDGPYRLVVDLPGVINRTDQGRFEVEQGGVVQVRTAQFRVEPTPISRVVFDLERPIHYEIRDEGPSLVVTFGEPDADVAATDSGELPEWTRFEAPATPTTIASSEPQPVEWVTEPAQFVEAAAEPAQPLEIAEAGSGDDPVDAVAELPSPTAGPAAEPVAAEPVEAVAEPASDPAPRLEAPRVEAPQPQVSAVEPQPEPRSLEPNALDRLLRTPPLAAEARDSSGPTIPQSFQTQRIETESVNYTGKRISLNLVDANIKEVFRLFHEISGINFVLDPSVEGRVTIVVDNVPWDQTLDLILKNNSLDKVLEGNVIRIATTEKLAQEAAQRKQLKEAKELEVEPVTITRTLSYAKAKEVERVIREGGVLSQRGKVIVDERTNTLIISDIPKKVEPLDRLISTLDAETPQVMIEARVVETSRDFVQDLGVVWGLNAIADASRGTSTGLAFPNQASVRYGLNLPGAGGASNLAFKFGNILDSFTLDIALNTLENEGRGRVLSSPKVATQNNERAEIEQGVRIPIVNTTATEINVEFVSASLRMEVTPQITAEGTIILDIIVENNSPDFVNTAGEIPSIRTQRAQTKVLIGDGGTTVIGGIFTVNEGRSETGVPWFRKVPVFGWLFKSQNITRQNRELLIFITPKIMKLS